MKRRTFGYFVVGALALLGCKPFSDPKISESDRLAQGPLDEVWTEQLYWRKKVSAYAQASVGGYPCGRCGLPMAMLTGHFTRYEHGTTFYMDSNGRRHYLEGKGCAPLCRDCWRDLQTPENRLPYYKALMDKWTKDGSKQEVIEAVLKAAREEAE